MANALINSLPDEKISDWSKLKAFADDKLNVTQNIKVVSHSIENIVGKEEMLVTWVQVRFFKNPKILQI